MVPQSKDVIAKIENSALPDDVKILLIWYADHTPKPWNVSIDENSKYQFGNELIWYVQPFEDQVSSFVTLKFAVGEFMYIDRERLWVGHVSYKDDVLHSLAYADPKNTPEYIWGLVVDAIGEEHAFLESHGPDIDPMG
jgi:hypothetical protein